MNHILQQQNNKLVNSLKNTLENTNKIVKPLAASRPVSQTELQQPIPVSQEIQKPSVGERLGATAGEVALSPFAMIGKFGEGILDAGASLIGTIGGWFDNDFQNDVDNWVKKDLIGDSVLGQTYANLQQQSYLNDNWVGQTLRGAWEGAWQSLPSLALSVLPGGQVVSLAALGVSAGGNGVEEALQGGGTHNQALLYGALSGATEVVTEKMFGGTNLTNKAYGSGYLDKLVGTGKGRFIKGMIEEGIEEGVSTFVNPLLQKMTFNKDAEFLTKNHLKQIGQDALVGGLSAGIMQGAANMTRVGRVSNNLQTLQETQQAKQSLFNKNNLNAESTAKIVADENRAKSNISKELQAMSEERRNKYLENNGLNRYFNADGTVKMLNNDNYNKNTYSPLLEGREEELVFKPLDNSVELTQDQQYAKEVFGKINRNQNVGVVFTNDLTIDKNGAYHNGVLYINANANALQQVVMHELTHSIEGSKQYNHFKNFIIKEIESNETLLKEFGSYFEKYSKVEQQYGNNIDTVKSNLIEQLIENDSETVAKYVSENLFTNEESISHLAKTDGNLFNKIYNWIKLKIENYQKRKSLTKEQREVFDFLRNAERLYKKALDARGKQTIDKQSKTQYSLSEKENSNGREEKDRLGRRTNTITSENTERHNLYDARAIRRLYEKTEFNNRTEEIKKYKNDILNGKHYTIEKANTIFGGKFVNENVKIVNGDCLTSEYLGIKEENIKLGIDTEFYLLDEDNTINIEGLRNGKLNKLFILLDERTPSFVTTNRHEKAHWFSHSDPSSFKNFCNSINSIMTKGEKVNLYNKFYNLYKDAYINTPANYIKNKIWNEIYAEIYASNVTLSNQQKVFDAIDKFENELKKQYKLKDDIKFSLADNTNDKITTNWGDGYNLADNRYEDYNLIAFKNDVGLNAFNALLNEVENLVASDYENKSDNISLRMKLFNNLQQQKNRVYSKLIEINQALDKTKKAYDKNEKINIKKTFIKSLGYNGLYVDPKSETAYKSVVYDINHKKENLLDYSQERAKDRLDKAIQIFGETKNPKKAGWLLSDGRFVDYNRDSANILSERDDIELDYQDHYQIEKVYSSRRGTDAIDAFMAEGNIRLMPEGGGIEVRNKPTIKQVSKLEEYINSIIDEKGIVLDLREPNTTENVLPNYVYYDTETNARTIINDINSFYNNGNIPRTIDGIRFSLADDVDNKNNTNYNYNEYQYEKFGWVRANNILNSLEWKDFNKKFIAARNGTKVKRAASGALIIPVNGLTSERFGINNVLVYAKGTISNPQIEKIIKINLDNETDIDIIRRDIYAAEKKSWTRTSTIIRYYYPEELVREYSNKDCPNYQEYLSRKRERRSRRESEKDTRVNRAVENGSRDFGSNKEDIKYSLDDKIYNDAQYEKFGWVRANEVLDSNQWQDFNKKFVAARNGIKVNRAAGGALIIPVNGLKSDKFGIDNVLVYVKGTISNPQIEKTIKINLANETEIDIVRRDIYERERNSNDKAVTDVESLYGQEIIREISQRDMPTYREYKESIRARESGRGSRENNKNYREQQSRGTNAQRNFEDIKYSLDDKRNNNKQSLMDSIDKQIVNEHLDKRNKLVNRILDAAQSLKDIKNKKYHNSGDVFFKELKAFETLLSGVKIRSDISKGTTRQRISEYGKFYNLENELISEYVDKNILEDIKFVSENKDSRKQLSTEELEAVDNIISNFKHIVTHYDTIFRNGRTEKVLDLANKGYKIIEQTPEIKETTLNKFVSTSLNPRVLFKQIDNFSPDGVITTLMNDVKNGETLAGKYKMDLEAPFKEFLKQHNNYIKELDKTKVTIRGLEISKNQALAILLTSERKQAQPHIKNGGISVYVNEGKWYNKHEVKRTIMPTEVDFKKISDSLTDVDKQYLDLVRTFFNKDAKQLKIDTDLKLKGYTNVEESNDYYPISVDRDVVARNLGDARSFASEIQSTYSYSFNKEIKQNAANRITVGDITSTVQRHIDNMANYAGLAEPIKNFDLVYNRNLAERDVNGNIVKGTEKSIRQISNAKWGNTKQYFAKYFNDILGVNKNFSSIDKFLNVVRGNYAKFQLGFNVKVWFNQLTSIPAAMTILDSSSISKGLAMKTNYVEMDKYCEYARFRNYDNSLVKSEALYDKIGKIGEISTAPISKFDRMAIGKLWNACQAQVEKNNNLSIDTEENKIKAGELLERVIRETQPNFNASERAGLLRSDNFLVKCFTMFMSQPLQNLSLLAESGMEFNVLRKMQKSGQVGLENRILEAKRKIKKSIAAVGAETILFVLVAQAFKYLFKKNDKEEPVLDVAKDFGGALTGMFPIFRDVYNKLVYRYDFDIFALDTLNSLGDSVNAMNTLMTKMASGEDVTSNQVLSVIKKLSMSLGQLTGIPTRNILNQLLGIIRNIDPELAEEIQHSYNANYGKKKASSATAQNNLQKTLSKAFNGSTKTTKKSSNNLQDSLNKILRSK